MWSYEKKLEYPVNIKNSNPAMAKVIVSQLGGPHGELGASMRYLNQRYSMPYGEVRGTLTDIGTEESKWSFWYFIFCSFIGIQGRDSYGNGTFFN